MEREKAKGAIFLSLGFALAGSATTAAKPLAGSLGPFSLTALSLAFALPALAPFAIRGPRPRARELLTTAALGFFGIFLYRLCLMSALARVSAAEAGLMTGAAPALAERPFRAIVALRPSAWLALAWYGLFVTAASYVCWYEGIRRTEASRAARSSPPGSSSRAARAH